MPPPPAQRTRLLVTGGTGLLGVNWAAAMRGDCDIWLGTHRRRMQLKGVQSVAVPLDSMAGLARVLDEVRPDIVVHAAGLSNVDECERAPEVARRINAAFAATVADLAASHRVKLVHISTDHLFAGDRPMLGETATPSPVNAYARGKLEGERLVAERCPQALIVRTNFFGWGHALRKSISDWVIGGLRAGQRLRAFDDVFFTPILASQLARSVHALVAAGASGVVHVCGDERVSKFEFAVRLAESFGLPVAGIDRGRYAEAGLAAPRPRDMSLSNTRARGILGRRLGGLDDFFSELRGQEVDGLAGELQRAVTE